MPSCRSHRRAACWPRCAARGAWRATVKGSGDTLALPRARSQGDDALNDDFYDEQLRSDGWHLDETSDDEQLDFSLPKALPSKQGNTSCECAPNVATLRRIKSRMSNQCAVM